MYRKCRRHQVALSWGLVALAVATTLLFGVIGFTELYGSAMPISTRIYLAIQLLALESGAVIEHSHVVWQLQLARWLGVVASLGAITNTLLALFARRIHRWVMRRRSGHAVVIGAGEAGTQLAKDLLLDGYRVTIIDSIEENLAIKTLVELGVDEIIGDASEQATLQAAAVGRAEYVVIVAGADVTNFEIMSAVQELCSKSDRSANPIKCYLHLVDDRLRQLAEKAFSDKQTLSFLQLTTFNRFANSARILLAKAPLDRVKIVTGDPRQVHLVIVDLGMLGESLLKAALAIGHYANNVPLAITVIDQSADEKENSLLIRIPEMHACGTIRFMRGTLEQKTVRAALQNILSDRNQLVTVAICRKNPQASLTGCMDLIPLLTNFNNTVFVNLADDQHEETLQRAFQSANSRVIPFGSSRESVSSGAVIRKHLDKLAEKIHIKYCEKRQSEGDSEQDYPAMRAWEILDGDLRDANRQQADYITVKLRAIGYQAVELKEDIKPEEFHPSRAEIEALAIAEHSRWCANRRLAGWRYGAARDNVARLHPNLVDWEKLDEETRDYDREPLRNLADMLAAVDYCIVKDEG